MHRLYSSRRERRLCCPGRTLHPGPGRDLEDAFRANQALHLVTRVCTKSQRQREFRHVYQRPSPDNRRLRAVENVPRQTAFTPTTPSSPPTTAAALLPLPSLPPPPAHRLPPLHSNRAMQYRLANPHDQSTSHSNCSSVGTESIRGRAVRNRSSPSAISSSIAPAYRQKLIRRLFGHCQAVSARGTNTGKLIRHRNIRSIGEMRSFGDDEATNRCSW